MIAGLIRFSILTRATLINWSQTSGLDVDGAANLLFNDGRMQARFQLFEAVTLPCLKQLKTNANPLVLCILVSPWMPTKWREKLETLVKGCPAIQLVNVDIDDDLEQTITQHLLSIAPKGTQTIATFRLDDDDCLRKDYTERLEKWLHPDYHRCVISCRHGIYLSHLPERLVLQKVRYRQNAFGITHISDINGFKSIFGLGPHDKLAKAAPLLRDESPNAWIRSLHEATDTAAPVKPSDSADRRYPMPPEDVADWLGSPYDYLCFQDVHRALRNAGSTL